MKEKKHYTHSGYVFTVQKINNKINHVYIRDTSLYPDSDSRSQDSWRFDGLLIPINNAKDLKEISKLFDL